MTQDEERCKCGEPHDGWPGEDGGQLCQMCWEAECDKTWWQVVNALMHDRRRRIDAHKECRKRIAELEADRDALQKEVERLREINIELVHTHNTLVVENARQERAIWRFSGDPRALAYAKPNRQASEIPRRRWNDG